MFPAGQGLHSQEAYHGQQLALLRVLMLVCPGMLCDDAAGRPAYA
jgi:hypothetical protein